MVGVLPRLRKKLGGPRKFLTRPRKIQGRAMKNLGGPWKILSRVRQKLTRLRKKLGRPRNFLSRLWKIITRLRVCLGRVRKMEGGFKRGHVRSAAVAGGAGAPLWSMGRGRPGSLKSLIQDSPPCPLVRTFPPPNTLADANRMRGELNALHDGILNIPQGPPLQEWWMAWRRCRRALRRQRWRAGLRALRTKKFRRGGIEAVCLR